ncbi:Phospholipid transfer protein [Larimichthys crocea]|nr:Phospholipid transfer protein [Larimichthys crocea]
MSPASNAESSSSVFQVDIFWLRMTPCLLSILFLLLFVCSVMSVTEPAGCKIRFTDKGLDMLKYETLKFVEEELSNISMPEMKGQDGHFQYNITEYDYNMIFKGMFFDLSNQNDTLKNYAIDPVIREYSRMVYLALSEFFFDSGMFAYYKAGIFQMHIVNEKMPKDLEMLLRTTYFGAIIMLNPALVDAPLSLQLAVNSPPKTTIKTSGATVVMTAIVQETTFNAKFSMKAKRLAVHADLRRFKIFSNQSALESLALIPLQAPLKTMLQMSVVPLINNWTKRGVRIPLADGMDLIEEVVEYHNGYIVIGANLHFSKGLREMITGDPKTEADSI